MRDELEQTAIELAAHPHETLKSDGHSERDGNGV